jgi:hypothetical protein
MTKFAITAETLTTLAQILDNHFTVKQVAEHFGCSEDTARKALRQIDGLQPKQEGRLMVWSFITIKVSRNKPCSEHKILRYFRAACYNAFHLNLTQEEMISKLQGWLDEYEVESAEFSDGEELDEAA